MIGLTFAHLYPQPLKLPEHQANFQKSFMFSELILEIH